MDNTNLQARPNSDESTKMRALVSSYIRQLSTALNQELSPERHALYLHGLEDLTEAELRDAFDTALKSAEKFFPSIAELRRWANEGAEKRHREKARLATKQILDRPGKPDDWNFKLEEAWDEVERREKIREQEDLQQPDMTWENAHAQGMRFVDWKRRHEAHERKRNGVLLIPARIRMGSTFNRVMAAARNAK